eukprot:jgi/Mesen1/10849/ME000093S10363
MGHADAGFKPARSDEVLSAEEQASTLAKVQAYFAENAPKRALKPSRSESTDAASGEKDVISSEIPEMRMLERLKAAGKLLPEVAAKVGELEDYVETMYYQNVPLDGVHHTTGTGFIQMGKPAEQWRLEGGQAVGSLKSKTNPGNNDWEPNTNKFSAVSTKPGRSEPEV